MLSIGDNTEKTFGRRKQWNLDRIYIADSALYSQDNLQQLRQLRWITRVPASLKVVNLLVESLGEETFDASEVSK